MINGNIIKKELIEFIDVNSGFFAAELSGVKDSVAAANFICSAVFKDVYIVNNAAYYKSPTHFICFELDTLLLAVNNVLLSNVETKFDFIEKVTKDVVARLKKKGAGISFECDSVKINLMNGVIELDTENNLTFRNRNNKDNFNYVLDYEYDANKCCPIFDCFLDSVLPERTLQRICIQFIASCFFPKSLEKSLFLLGSGQNGKSTLLNVMEQLLGAENVSRINYSELANDNKRRSIINKLLNISSEIGSRASIGALFKQLVSNEPVTVKYLYKDTITTAYNTRFAFAMNTLPKIHPADADAFARRVLVVRFNKTVEKPDLDLLDKLKNERAGILNKVIIELKYLNENRAFIDCPYIEKERRLLIGKINNLDTFIQKYFEVSFSGYNYLSDLYLWYCTYCDAEGYEPVRLKEFSRVFSRFFVKKRKNDGIVFDCSINQLFFSAYKELLQLSDNDDKEVNEDKEANDNYRNYDDLEIPF